MILQPLKLNLLKQAAAVRCFNTSSVKNSIYYVNPKTFKEEFFLKPAAHAKATYNTWWYAFWCGFIPLTIVAGINAYFLEKEHLSHPPPPYIPYDHLYATVTKRYPWGDGKRSLFFNPKRNALPGVGYVDE